VKPRNRSNVVGRKPDRGSICGGDAIVERVVFLDAFVGAEEKCLVADDRPAERAAPLLALVRRLGEPAQSSAGLLRTNAVVFEEPVPRALYVVRAGLRDAVHDAADGAAVLGAAGELHYLEFLNRILAVALFRQREALVHVVEAVDEQRRLRRSRAAKAEA